MSDHRPGPRPALAPGARTSSMPRSVVGFVSLLGAVSGCENDPCEDVGFDPPPAPEAPSAAAPPTVISGEWIGSGVLELRFSKPLMATGELDPQRFAIVSWNALASTYYGDSKSCALRTAYLEIGVSYYGGQYNGVRAAWIGPEDPSVLRVQVPANNSTCRLTTPSRASGVMLVYTSAPEGGPALLDGAGELVPDIGEPWVLTRLENCLGNSDCGTTYYSSNGHLPRFDTLLPIPCP